MHAWQNKWPHSSVTTASRATEKQIWHCRSSGQESTNCTSVFCDGLGDRSSEGRRFINSKRTIYITSPNKKNKANSLNEVNKRFWWESLWFSHVCSIATYWVFVPSLIDQQSISLNPLLDKVWYYGKCARPPVSQATQQSRWRRRDSGDGNGARSVRWRNQLCD
jgi:hypothetical protein